ncbi:hypothetical protein MMC07_009781 [Pseudocyphellaria aurata]|nr:hypothetical protein [Pseudocyphellaria aurata]
MPPKRKPLQAIGANRRSTLAATENEPRDSEDAQTNKPTRPLTKEERKRKQRKERVAEFNRQMKNDQLIVDWKNKVNQGDDATNQARAISPGRGKFIVAKNKIKSSDRTESFKVAGEEIKRNDTVELTNGAFIQIRDIYAHKPEPVIVGWLFERNTRLKGWLPRIEDEVFWLWVFDFTLGETIRQAKTFRAQAKTSEVVRKWELQMAPPNVTRYDLNPQSSVEKAKENASRTGTLICSWVFIRPYDKYSRIEEYTHIQCYNTYRIESALVAIAAKRPERPIPTEPRYKYTFGDAFAGCGGVSRAAKMAGLKVRWGFDHDSSAHKSYTRNFRRAMSWKMSAEEFVGLSTEQVKVDILHLSPPCQYFSPAHTVPGPHDFENVKSLFYIPAILGRTKPRVVTVEEVVPLATRHPEIFAHLVQFFTWSGYNIQWKSINCADFGVPQNTRRRLIMIGSSPGVFIPCFPSPTHHSIPSGRLKRWRTVADAINNIEPGSSDNKPERVLHGITWQPYDLNAPHPVTVQTRKPMKSRHLPAPGGSKPFTIRELACLQTFPTYHKFCGKYYGTKWAQIGNAVPPWLGYAILREVKKALRVTDGRPANETDSDSDGASDSDPGSDSDGASDPDPATDSEMPQNLDPDGASDSDHLHDIDMG